MSKEDFSLKERLEFAKTVNHGRKDPVWFLKEIIGWTTMYPMQEEIIRNFYQNKYNPALQKYKKLVARCGQRCISGDTLIATNNGLISLKELYPSEIYKDDNVDIAIDLDNIQVYNGEKWTPAESIVYAGKKKKCIITTEYGFQIECSEDHKFYTFNGSEFKWKSAKELDIDNDFVESYKDLHLELPADITLVQQERITSFVNINKTKYTLPTKITAEVAVLMGMLVADGDIASKGKMRFTKTESSLVDIYCDYMLSQFNLDCKVYDYKNGNPDTKSIEIYNEQVRNFLYAIGLDYTDSYTKHIPDCILHGNRDLKVSFLSGYFSCDGNVQESKSGNSKKCRVTATTVSKQLAYELQQMLLELGILSSISISKSVEFGTRIKRDNNAYTLNLFGGEILKFYDAVKLVSAEKQSKFDDVYASQKSKRTKGRTTPMMQSLMHKWFIKTHNMHHIWEKGTKEFQIDNYVSQYKGGSSDIDRLLQSNILYLRVKSIDYSDELIDMYDLYVPEGNCYVANGFLTHNSGKTVLGSKIAIYEFFELISLDSPAEHYGLLKNNEIGINCLASSKDIALEGMFSIMRNDIQENEWFNQWFDLKVTDGRIACEKKHVYAKTVAARADSGSTGSTSKLALLDEVDLFQRTESKVGADIVISKALNSTQSLGLDGKFVAISSTQYTDGPITKLYYDGQTEATTLTYNLPTWQMNPRMTKEMLMEEYKYKMHMFWRDFANQPEVSGGLMFPDKVKFNRNMDNVFTADEDTLEEYSQFYHCIALDPAFRNDAFGMAAGYRNGDHIVIDGVMKYTKEHESDAFIKPSDMEREIEKWVNKLNVTTLLYDCDLVLNIIEKAQDQWGINTVKNIVGEKEYGIWLNLNDNVGELDLDIVYNEFAVREVEQLVKIQLPSGKIRVDHPYAGCFVGETRIRLLDGTCPTIEELSTRKDDFWVCSCDNLGDLVPGKARARLTKYTDELLDIVLDSGAVIRCTPDHRFMLRNGNYIEARDITPQVDRLMPCNISHIGNDGYLSYSHPLRNDKEKNSYSRKSVHRIIARYVFGREIESNELIHHINENKTDNRPENLEILSQQDHAYNHTTQRHHSDKNYSEKAVSAMYAFNTSDEGRKFRSNIMKKVMEDMPDEKKKQRARHRKTFRSDVTIDMVIDAKNEGSENAFQASKTCGCGRNVIMRILKDHGYSSWEEFMNPSGDNHRVLYIIPVKLNNPVPVYDIEVDKWHNFALTAGVFVHNSKDVSDTICNCIWYLSEHEGAMTRNPVSYITTMRL